MMKKKQLLVFIMLLTMVAACSKAPDLVPELFVGFKRPAHFPEPVYNFATNPLSKEGFDLGKKLFYDPILSRNNTISCGSCHISQHAFTHHGHDLSHGVDDQLGTRNAMPLMNLAWSPTLFWDGGVLHLDLSPVAPIENPVEMDEKLANVVSKLQQSQTYPALFEKAFGSPKIQSAQVLLALSQFMTTLVSADSKYDQVKLGTASFTDQEQRGYALFQSKCNTCHREPLFTDYSFRDNGIGISTLQDYGRYTITNQETDKLKFKVPSLRNLKFTAPYMHDGRFYTLEAVMNHYKREVIQTANLDPILRSNNGIALTDEETQQLLAFLNTLNDETFINNKQFSE